MEISVGIAQEFGQLAVSKDGYPKLLEECTCEYTAPILGGLWVDDADSDPKLLLGDSDRDSEI